MTAYSLKWLKSEIVRLGSAEWCAFDQFLGGVDRELVTRWTDARKSELVGEWADRCVRERAGG